MRVRVRGCVCTLHFAGAPKEAYEQVTWEAGILSRVSDIARPKLLSYRGMCDERAFGRGDGEPLAGQSGGRLDSCESANDGFAAGW